MITASKNTALASPIPNSLMMRSSPRAKDANTRIMIEAAAVITLPVVCRPRATEPEASPVRSHSSWTREIRNTS